jgi:hypothetical protein
MFRQYWHKGSDRSDDDHAERSSGYLRRHHNNFYQDGEPHERLHGGKSDIHENRDRGNPPDYHFRSDCCDRWRDHEDASGSSMRLHEGGRLEHRTRSRNR